MAFDGTDECKALLSLKKKIAKQVLKGTAERRQHLIDAHRFLQVNIGGKLYHSFYVPGTSNDKIKEYVYKDWFCSCCISSFEWHITQDTPKTLIAEVTSTRNKAGELSDEVIPDGDPVNKPPRKLAGGKT